MLTVFWFSLNWLNFNQEVAKPKNPAQRDSRSLRTLDSTFILLIFSSSWKKPNPQFQIPKTELLVIFLWTGTEKNPQVEPD